MRVMQGWTPLHSSNVGGYEYHVNGRFAALVFHEFFPKTKNKDLPVVATLSRSNNDGSRERFATVQEAQEWVESKVIENELMKGEAR